MANWRKIVSVETVGSNHYLLSFDDNEGQILHPKIYMGEPYKFKVGYLYYSSNRNTTEAANYFADE